MWNEGGGRVGGQVEGPGSSHVMHVGRSWFRMTPVSATAIEPIPSAETARIGVGLTPTPNVRMASSLFDRRALLASANEARRAKRARGSVTAPWWLLGVGGTGLLVMGAVFATMLRPPATSVSALEPAATTQAPSRGATGAPGAASSMVVEPIVGPVPVVHQVPVTGARSASAPVVRGPLAAARRVRAAARKREKPDVATEPAPASSAAAWVDPFAE